MPPAKATTAAPPPQTTTPQPASPQPATATRTSSAKRTLPEGAQQDPTTLAASSEDTAWRPSIPERVEPIAPPTSKARGECPRPVVPIYGTHFPRVARSLSRPAPDSQLSRPQVHSTTLIDLLGAEVGSTQGHPEEAILRELAALDLARNTLEQSAVRGIVALDVQRARLVKAAAASRESSPAAAASEALGAATAPSFLPTTSKTPATNRAASDTDEPAPPPLSFEPPPRAPVPLPAPAGPLPKAFPVPKPQQLQQREWPQPRPPTKEPPAYLLPAGKAGPPGWTPPVGHQSVKLLSTALRQALDPVPEKAARLPPVRTSVASGSASSSSQAAPPKRSVLHHPPGHRGFVRKPNVDVNTGLNLDTEFDVYVDAHGVFDDSADALDSGPARARCRRACEPRNQSPTAVIRGHHWQQGSTGEKAG